VGDDNIIIFGMNVDEVEKAKPGYRPMDYYNQNGIIHQALDTMTTGINGELFNEVAHNLKTTDTYMTLADFDSYQKAQAYASECYKDQMKWQKMSLANIANAGIFSADRSVEDYARDIWKLTK
ncbi:MAG: glycogen/starch/alpha-glucan phosphorylase, partial [Ruminococcus sp.]|nr:glycogen/starch/alpha-glucan phosphorylase [Ruminococcus sp.]